MIPIPKITPASTAIAASAALCVSILLSYYRRAMRPKNVPPLAPFWLPLLGHTLMFLRGNPLIGVPLLVAATPKDTNIVELQIINGMRVYMIWGAENVRAVLTKTQLNTRSPPNPEGLKEVGLHHQGLLMNTDIDAWKLNRKYFLESLGKPKFINSVPARISAFMEDIFPLLDTCAATNVVVPMHDIFASLSMDLIMDIVNSEHLDATRQLLLKITNSPNVDDKGANVLKVFRSFMASVFFFARVPTILYTTLPGLRSKAAEYRKVVQQMHQILDEMIEKKKEVIESDPTGSHTDLLSCFILASKDSKAFKTSEVRASLKEVLLGGTDTSSSTMAFTLYELAKNPEIQEQAFGEVRDHITEGQVLDKAVLDKLPFIEACLDESLRIHSVTSGVPRLCTEDVTVNGYEIKKGSVLVVSNLINTFDENYFPEPQKFNPSRFLQEHENRGGPLGLGFTYTPFGYGSRKCPGENLAMMEMKAVMASLILRYKFKLADPVKPMDKHVALTIECSHLPIFVERR